MVILGGIHSTSAGAVFYVNASILHVILKQWSVFIALLLKMYVDLRDSFKHSA
jgi:hypothetical protein